MQRTFSVAVVICVVLGFAIADFREDAIKRHNCYRAKHHAPPLTQSQKLNKIAQNYARKMAKTNNFGHSGGRYGENIWMYPGKMSDAEAVVAATKDWYAEVANYDYNNPGFGMDTGHFTQVVWKDTKQMGIGVGRSKSGTYVCGNYDPPGNYDGEFKENVLAP